MSRSGERIGAGTWDTIVIGSGAGGLTAAVALARAGQRVLVLEQHYLPGGWCHSFTLDGYRFSPGVHYIGGLQEGGPMRSMYEGLGVSPYLEFCELNPDGYDHVIVAGERFDIPRGFSRYFQRLVARFPRERDGLMRYFAVIDAIAEGLAGFEDGLSPAKLALLPFKHPALLRYGFSTLDVLLDNCIRDPRLRAILAAQCGNHGLPPSRAALTLHSTMTKSYYDGAYYPRGGAKSLPAAMIKVLRQHRGKIRLRTPVGRILLDGRRAIGVELADGERIFSESVISNADPATTFGKLVPREVAGRERKKIAKMEYGTSLLSVFCAVERDLRGEGFDSGNYWWYRHDDIESIYRKMEVALPGGRVDGLFMTITTLKDPGHVSVGNHHTIEMFTFVPHAPFARWADTPQGARGTEYEVLKASLGRQVLDAAEELMPGIRKDMRFCSVGTPLTSDFYCNTHQGSSYGSAKTPWQLGPFSFQVRCGIEHLYNCGQSTLSHGVGGASLSGLMAAKEVVGCKQVTDLLRAGGEPLEVHPADQPELWLPQFGVKIRRPTSSLARGDGRAQR